MRSWEAESGFPLGFLSNQTLYWGKSLPSSLWSLAKCRDLKLWVLVAPRLYQGRRTAVTLACWPLRQDHFTEFAGGISLGLASKIYLYSCVPTCIFIHGCIPVPVCVYEYMCVPLCEHMYMHIHPQVYAVGMYVVCMYANRCIPYSYLSSL